MHKELVEAVGRVGRAADDGLPEDAAGALHDAEVRGDVHAVGLAFFVELANAVDDGAVRDGVVDRRDGLAVLVVAFPPGPAEVLDLARTVRSVRACACALAGNPDREEPEREYDCDGVGRCDNRLGFDELQVAEPAALLEHVLDGVEAVSDAQEVWRKDDLVGEVGKVERAIALLRA